MLIELCSMKRTITRGGKPLIFNEKEKEVLIRDKIKVNEIIREKLDALNHVNKIRYSYVDKVKIRNRFTREEQVLKDVYFIATSNNSCKPSCVMGLKSGDNTYMLHDDITHWNMCESLGTMTFGNDIFIVRTFCNTVLCCHIWEDPDAASKFLKGNLMEGNPNDRYRTPDSTEVDKRVPPIITTAGYLKKDATFEQVVLRRINTSEKSRNDLIKLRDLKNKLTDGKVYAYVANAQEINPEFTFDIVDKKDIESGKLLVSEYYKQYESKDVEEIGEIPKEEIDIGCIGCGSAGANIMEQLNRTEYFRKYLLLDYDTIEAKNLRNQPYSRFDVSRKRQTHYQIY